MTPAAINTKTDGSSEKFRFSPRQPARLFPPENAFSLSKIDFHYLSLANTRDAHMNRERSQRRRQSEMSASSAPDDRDRIFNLFRLTISAEGEDTQLMVGEWRKSPMNLSGQKVLAKSDKRQSNHLHVLPLR